MSAPIPNPAYAPCPDHDGRWFHKFGGACDCGSSHSLLDHDVANDLGRKLAAERRVWVASGARSECVRPAGEAFGWRQGSGPCDCPPCIHASAQAHVPHDAGTDSSEGD